MANYRKKKKKINNEPQKIEISTVSCEIDYDRLAEAISKAQRITKKQEEKDYKEKKAEWQESIGMKDVAEKKMSFHNVWRLIIFVLNFDSKKKYSVKYESDDVIFVLSQTALSLMYKFIQWIVNVLVLIIGFKGFYDFFHGADCLNGIIILFDVFLANFIAQIFNIASYESFNIKDKNYLMTVLSATTCSISLVIAFISLLFGILTFLRDAGIIK